MLFAFRIGFADLIRSFFGPKVGLQCKTRHASPRLCLEMLEDRLTPSSFTTTTTISVMAPSPASYGFPVILSGTVTANGSPGTPVGSVQITDNGNVIGSGALNNGVFSLTVSSLSVGAHAFQANFLGGSVGSDSYSPSSSGVSNLTINKADTSIILFSISPSPSVYGTGFDLSATLSGYPTGPGVALPTGKIQFKEGTTVLGEGSLQNNNNVLTASFTVTGQTLDPGAHPITAVYVGDDNYKSSSAGPLTHSVEKALSFTTLTAAPNPSKYGQAVDLSASVQSLSSGAGTPTGTVIFREVFDFGFNDLGSAQLSGGTAGITVDSLSGGLHNLAAVYNGSIYFLGSQFNVPQLVEAADTTMALSADPSTADIGANVQLKATVSVVSPGGGTPTGFVFFTDTTTGTGLGSGTLSGSNGTATASITVSFSTAGDHNIQAFYISDLINYKMTDASTTVTINSAANQPPVLDSIGDKSVDEETTLSFSVSAHDPDQGQSVTLTATGLPAGASFTSAGGVGFFSWTPSEAQGPGTYSVTFTATDDGSPSKNVSETITITVGEVNRPPVLDSIGNQTVDEETELAFAIFGHDPDDPANELTYSASGLPDGASFDPDTGTFTWTPTEEQGANTYVVTFTVTDDGSPNLSDSKLVTITVNEVNKAPEFNDVSDQFINVNQTLDIYATATDPDLPANIPGNTLTYSIDQFLKNNVSVGVPDGLFYDSVTGHFTWTPDCCDTGDYTVTLRVVDHGEPQLDDFVSFNIHVPNMPAPAGFTIFWTGCGDGIHWNDPDNWNEHRLPEPGDRVLIDTPPCPDADPTTTVIHDAGEVTIDSLVSHVALNFAGSLTLNNGPSLIDKPFGFSGALDLASGTNLNLSGGGSIGGNMNIDAPAVLNFLAGSFALANGTLFAGTGEVVAGGQAQGNVTVQAGSAEFQARFTLNSNFMIDGPGTVQIEKFNWVGGKMDGGGVTEIIDEMSITGAAAKDVAKRTINLYGTTNWSGGNISLTKDSKIDNKPGAIFNLLADRSISSSGLGARFDNAGTISKIGGSGQLGSVFGLNVTLSNSGEVQVHIGTLRIRGGGQQTGTFAVDAGTILRFDQITDKTILQAGTQLNGNGQYSVGGSAALQVADGVSVSPKNLELLPMARIDGPGAINAQFFTWTGGTLAGEAKLTVLNAQIDGDGAKSIDRSTMTITSQAEWAGASDITMIADAQLRNLGMFRIRNDQTIVAVVDDDVPLGMPPITPSVVNVGTFVKENGTKTVVQAIFTNRGNLQLSTAAGFAHNRLDFARGVHQVAGSTALNENTIFADGIGFVCDAGTVLAPGTILGLLQMKGGELRFNNISGVLNVGRYVQQKDARLVMNIGGKEDSQHNRIVVSTEAEFGGVLELAFTPQMSQTVGNADEFTNLVTYQTGNGRFDQVIDNVPPQFVQAGAAKTLIEFEFQPRYGPKALDIRVRQRVIGVVKPKP